MSIGLRCSRDVSIIIKTFERKESLRDLLLSIRHLGMTYPIIIADDSQTPYKNDILEEFHDLDIDYHTLPYDSGLSFGRNYLLDHVRTEFFVLCDDDFYFDEKTDIEKAREILISEKVDILSGSLFNYFKRSKEKEGWLLKLQKRLGLGFVQTFVGKIQEENRKVIIKIRTRVRERFVRAHTVHNFFIARTETIKAMGGWDPRLKLSEHSEFFFRAKKHGVKVAHSGLWSTRHYPLILPGYQQFRKRDYDILVFDKHQIDLWIEEVDNGSTFIRQRSNDGVTMIRVFHKNLRGMARYMYTMMKRVLSR